MGPIETFGLLANTLSYLRVMAVGVAGVKIAEIGNNMGFASMTDAVAAGDYLFVPLFFLIWIGSCGGNTGRCGDSRLDDVWYLLKNAEPYQIVVWEGVAIECAESIDERHSLKL